MDTEKQTKSNNVTFAIESPPMNSDQLTNLRSSLKSKHFSYLNGVITIIILAIIATMKVISLDFEHDQELLRMSLYIGGCIGLFSSISIRGNRFKRIHMLTIGIVACTAAGLCSSMLMTLFLGHTPSWITSISVLASALASMWLLTYYDETIKAISSIKFVNSNQLDYIIKASNRFDSLMEYAKSIHQKDRKPVMGEYWVIRDWIDDNKKTA